VRCRSRGGLVAVGEVAVAARFCGSVLTVLPDRREQTRLDPLWLRGQCLRSRPDGPRPPRDDHADKAELIAKCAPSQPWGPQRAVAVEVIRSYRLDPDARVGMAFPSRNFEGRP